MGFVSVPYGENDSRGVCYLLNKDSVSRLNSWWLSTYLEKGDAEIIRQQKSERRMRWVCYPLCACLVVGMTLMLLGYTSASGLFWVGFTCAVIGLPGYLGDMSWRTRHLPYLETRNLRFVVWEHDDPTRIDRRVELFANSYNTLVDRGGVYVPSTAALPNLINDDSVIARLARKMLDSYFDTSSKLLARLDESTQGSPEYAAALRTLQKSVDMTARAVYDCARHAQSVTERMLRAKAQLLSEVNDSCDELARLGDAEPRVFWVDTLSVSDTTTP